MCGKTQGDGYGPEYLWGTLRGSLGEPEWICRKNGATDFGARWLATAVANRPGANPGDIVLLRKEGARWIAVGGYVDTILTISSD